MMKFQIDVKGRQFACNAEQEGVFELIRGAYTQHRGTDQAPAFRDEAHFRRYVQRMLAQADNEQEF
jgi:hypothetical protein